MLKAKISKETILSNRTDVGLIITNKINIEGNPRIEYGMVVFESEYEIYNQNLIEIDKTYYNKDNLNNEIENINYKVTFAEFHISITNDCNSNCLIFKNDLCDECITCEIYI